MQMLYTACKYQASWDWCRRWTKATADMKSWLSAIGQDANLFGLNSRPCICRALVCWTTPVILYEVYVRTSNTYSSAQNRRALTLKFLSYFFLSSVLDSHIGPISGCYFIHKNYGPMLISGWFHLNCDVDTDFACRTKAFQRSNVDVGVLNWLHAHLWWLMSHTLGQQASGQDYCILSTMEAELYIALKWVLGWFDFSKIDDCGGALQHLTLYALTLANSLKTQGSRWLSADKFCPCRKAVNDTTLHPWFRGSIRNSTEFLLQMWWHISGSAVRLVGMNLKPRKHL